MYGSMEYEIGRPRILAGLTFDGVPFSIAMEHDRAIGNADKTGVYKGHLLIGEPLVVAVKVFGQMLSIVQRELLIRELRAARDVSLGHPLLLAFLGTADVGPQTALVSLYMRNGTLLEYIKAQGDCDKKQLILQVAEAVDFLHTTRGLVHGDIKCGNVLVSDYGEALLADFGLNTYVEKSESASATMTTVRPLSLRFAAPEFFLEAPDVSMRTRSKTCESDVYAFGMLILEAVTEAPPWKGSTDLAVMQSVCSGKRPPRPLREVLVSISHAAWELCLHCWRTEPIDRPKMHDVLEALRASEIEPIQLMDNVDAVRALAYMPNGRHVVSGFWSGAVSIWDTRSGLVIGGPMRGHVSPILCVATSPDGRYLASSSADLTICLWDAISATAIGKPIRLRHAAHCIGFSPDGSRFAYGEGTHGYMRDAMTGAVLGDILQGCGSQVNATAFSPDGSLIAFGSDDGIVRLLDSATGMQLTTLSQLQSDRGVNSLAFSPDHVHLATGSRFQALRIWNILEQFLERELDEADSNASAVVFSPSGQYVAGAGAGVIRIWDAQTGQLIAEHPGADEHSGTSVAFSPDGRSLVACAQGGGILLWDLFE